MGSEMCIRDRDKKRSLTKLNYFKYLSVSILSLGVNLSVLQFVLNQYMPEIKAFAQLAGIASGTLVNYLGVKRWIFNEK